MIRSGGMPIAQIPKTAITRLVRLPLAYWAFAVYALLAALFYKERILNSGVMDKTNGVFGDVRP